ncbi:MAG: glycosyltransferase, partial [Candidatus Lokiarchaeota archaeon]|nr:glycosyltransferase [Candidatus Lokiarchaeota archaeon]
GFDIETIKSGLKTISDKIRFGYLGRVIPVKGIAFLIDSFNELDHFMAELNIYGKLPNSFNYLKNRCSNSAIHFKGCYTYNEISNVLSEIDVLVVPSIWYENSPLVIHGAFIAKIPIIASNIGGIAELVIHEKNGLLVEPRNITDLIEKMKIFIENPELIECYSQETYVRSIQEDVEEIEKLYHEILRRKEES